MTSRGRSTMPSSYGSRDSSPDPLAMSMDEDNTKTTRSAKPKRTHTASSPNKQVQRMAMPEFDLSSPVKSMIMNTPRTGGASPWRIKVTVQAEPESNEDNSPSVQRYIKTKTTTVPLKDHDAQTPGKRGRGRPRKSEGGTPAKPKRKATPVKRGPRSVSREASLGLEYSSTAEPDTDVPAKRRRGRPRKSVQPHSEGNRGTTMEETQAQDEHMLEDMQPLARPVVRSRPTKHARFETPDENESDLEHVNSTPVPPPSEKEAYARRGTPYAKKTVNASGPSEDDSDGHSHTLTPDPENDEDEMLDDIHYPPIEDTLRSQSGETSAAPHTPQDEQFDMASSNETDDEDARQEQTGMNFAFDEGTTRMPDDTTVMDSENFTMISVDSLRGKGLSPPKADDAPQASSRSIDSLIYVEHLEPKADVIAALAPRSVKSPMQTLPEGEKILVSTAAMRPPLTRFKTPVPEGETPSVPPTLQAAQASAQKIETPKIGRVVTAGVALQGALDPSRVTPDNLRHDAMDDLFRGFSEGTRKDLQAGLRLGQQLAESQSPEAPAPSQSGPARAPLNIRAKPGVFKTQRKIRPSRLLTPEDQDDQVITNAEPAEPAVPVEVQYPALNVEDAEHSLLSPAESDNEMSWRVDTPPASTTGSARSLFGTENIENKAQNASQTTVEPPKSATMSTNAAHDDYADIWQEEASRSSNSLDAESAEPSKSSDPQDLFVEADSTRLAKGKFPRTWRRKGLETLRRQDDADAQQRTTKSSPVAAPAVETLRQEDADGEVSDASEASDDTGMFFQSNMPRLFSKKPSSELRQRRADKQSLSALFDQGESLLPDSSPPVITKTSPATKANPFTTTPPRFSGFPSSPSKSSPLRRELRTSEISSDPPRRIEDESTLPILQSSPFHTFVDGDSKLTAASDQRQFRHEMEGSTSASVRQVRNEADEYLEAYEPMERSLEGITEITEPSRTWNGRSGLLSVAPRRPNFAPHVRSPTPKVVPQVKTPVIELSDDEEEIEEEESEESSVDEHTPPSSNAASQEDTTTTTAAAAAEQDRQSTDLLTRVTSTLTSTFTRKPAPTIAPHPILSHLITLPKVEPWTRTHYKALDKLYTTHLKHPALFSPISEPSTPLSITNEHLLNKFLAVNKEPYVDATYSAWGYSMQMTEELVVLCAVFMENLTLASITEYEEKTGRNINMGDCVPGRSGDVIKGADVLKRLATVVMGESVRRDEKMGRFIDRSIAMEIEWP